ncbi:hypothetical protein BRC73_04715 [Halobacteriales archaeon QH_7_66_37]|nr:MAG: hypothetical protein BRC73_04715 [Halobacteriales archaeon QH_7_66_37]
MRAQQRRSVGPVDLLYGGCFLAGVVQRQPSTGVGLWMALFALLVLLVDWVETRRLLERGVETRRTLAVAFGLTLAILVTWYLLATRPPTALGAYFGLLAGFFFLQALRDAAVLDLTPVEPVELLSRGYVNLVAVYLVFGVAADAVDRFQVGLVLFGAVVYLVRKWFRWGEAVVTELGLADS